MTPRSLLIGGLLSFAVVAGSSRERSLQAQVLATPEPVAEQVLVDKYCVTCHNARTLSGNLSLAGLDASKPGDHPEVFEKVVRKVRAGLMPPAGMPRPETTRAGRLCRFNQRCLGLTDNPNKLRFDATGMIPCAPWTVVLAMLKWRLTCFFMNGGTKSQIR